MNPTGRDIHQDSVLSNVSVKYANGEAIADLVFPRVKVKKDSDIYYKYVRNFRLPTAYRAPGSEANKIEWNVETDTYFCFEWALKGQITDQDRRNADQPLNLDIDTTEDVTDALIRLREKRVADIAFASAFITNGVTRTGTQQWNDFDNSDPFGDFETGMLAVEAACGKRPNLVVLGASVMSKLHNHPDLLDRIKYTQKGVVTADLLASLLSYESPVRVAVGSMMYDAAQEGAAENLTRIWGKKALIAYVEPSPALKRISLAYQLYSEDRYVIKYREEKERSDYVEVTETSDEKLVAAACGYLITDAVA